MMKSICILLLLAVAVFAKIEERKAQLVYATISSTYGSPLKDVNAPLIYDGNNATIEHSGNIDKQPFLQFAVQTDPFYVSYVDVVNRNDACGWNCQSRISPFTVFIGPGLTSVVNSSVEELKTFPDFVNHWRTTEGVAPSYRVPFPYLYISYARLQQHTNDYLNLAEVSFVQMWRPPYLGTASSSQYPEIPTWNPSKAYDANPNSWFHSDYEQNTHPWLELQFAAQKICRVVIFNRAESCCSSRLLPFTVALKNGAFTTTGRTLRSTICGEPGAVCSASRTGPVTDYYEVDFSSEPMADRVRLVQENIGYLNVAEVHAYACSFPPGYQYNYGK